MSAGPIRFVVGLLLLQFRFAPARKRICGSRPRRQSAPFVELAATPSPEEMVFDEALARAHLVDSLPGMPFGYDHAMYAGDVWIYEPTLRNNGSIFYWFFESQHDPATNPLVIWLNGGPGCSSMEGVLIEHGPFLAVAQGFDLELNPYSWNSRANMLYIDQPVGTGYAVLRDGAFAQSQDQVNVMFMTFLRRWMSMYPRFKAHPTFLAGESYAGRYIPHFAHLMLGAPGEFNLQGVMIGNGWTDPMVQTESLPDYSFNMGLISAQQKTMIDNITAECRRLWDLDPYAHETWVTCETIQTSVPGMTGNNQIGTINIYDVRLYDTTAGGEWPWRSTGEKSYLNREDVRQALNVKSTLKWEECSDDVEEHLAHEDMYPTVNLLEGLLPHIRVLLYNGQFDWICNHLGVERMTDAMNFSGKSEFVEEELRGLWVVGSRLAGYVKHGGNLTYVTILGGSHMVPMDKRPQTLELLMRFLQNERFTDLASLGFLGEPMAVAKDVGDPTLPDVPYALPSWGRRNDDVTMQPWALLAGGGTLGLALQAAFTFIKRRLYARARCAPRGGIEDAYIHLAA